MPTLVTRKRNLKHDVPARLVASLGNAMLATLELPSAELSVLLTDDAEIHRLNREHRQKDKPTDVLAFAMDESVPDPAGILGDVVISLDTAERQARSRKRPLVEEVRFLLAHGVLHLIGYDHAEPEEKREMVTMTKKLVRLAPLPDAPPRRPKSPRKLSKSSKKRR
ncbi:MAG: rRNA maturation RNase YbeY [Myxococcales bacterium]|nr:MAG: rRNA maturation RNase YbeY [Myxococcales bacterium]